MPDTSRIEELQRRVQRDPASIAFAQLAEEYRRAGRYQEAIETCESGLDRHPGYLSARVTLGRSLLETGELEGAQQQLKQVLRAAPENLAALRGLAEIYHRRGELHEALAHYRAALEFARHDPELEHLVEQISRELEPQSARPAVADGMSFEEVKDAFLNLSLAGPAAGTVSAEDPALATPFPFDGPAVEPSFGGALETMDTPAAVEPVVDVAARPDAAVEAAAPDQELEAILQSLSEGVSVCPSSGVDDEDRAAVPAVPASPEEPASLMLPAPERDETPEGLDVAAEAATEAASEGAGPVLEMTPSPAWDFSVPPTAADEAFGETVGATSEAAADTACSFTAPASGALRQAEEAPSGEAPAAVAGEGQQIDALQRWLDAIIADRQRQG